MQSRYQLDNGTETIVHEDHQNRDEFRVDFTPQSHHDCQAWVELLLDVMQRQAKMQTTALNFKFDPATLPRNNNMASTSDLILGIGLAPDDHQRGGILTKYSPSKQMKLHGIPLESALVRVNALEVVHLPHHQVLEALGHAMKNAKRVRRERMRHVTLEWCSKEDYYECVCLLCACLLVCLFVCCSWIGCKFGVASWIEWKMVVLQFVVQLCIWRFDLAVAVAHMIFGLVHAYCNSGGFCSVFGWC